MFNPAAKSNEKAQKSARKKAISTIKAWCMTIIPTNLHEGLMVDVNEIVCGDPSCAPIDTVFTLLWESGGKGIFAMPMSAVEVTQEDLLDFFPDEETMSLWASGKKARWPPLPKLRFEVGARVECRTGPHPVKGWAPGRVIKLHYSEPNWPPNMVAPYQIALHDGRLIFAPQDTDQVIRLRPPAAPDAPSSPEYVPQPDDYEYDEEEEEEEEDGEGAVGGGGDDDEDNKDEPEGEGAVEENGATTTGAN